MPNPLKRLEALAEIFESEKSYIKDLSIWNNEFRKTILSLDFLDVQMRYLYCEHIFMNLEQILDMHNHIVKEIDKKITEESEKAGIAHQPLDKIKINDHNANVVYRNLDFSDVYIKNFPNFSSYRIYAQNLPYSDFFINKIITNNLQLKKDFEDFMSQRRLESLGYSHFLYRPTQKLPRYPLLFKAVKKNEENTGIINKIDCIITKFGEISKEVDLTYGTVSNEFKVYKLNYELSYSSIINNKIPLALYSKNRQILKEIDAYVQYEQIKEPKICRIIILDHILLICDTEKRKHLEYKKIITEPFILYKYKVVSEINGYRPPNSYFSNLSSLFLVGRIDQDILTMFFENEKQKTVIYKILDSAIANTRAKIDPSIKIVKLKTISSSKVKACTFPTFLNHYKLGSREATYDFNGDLSAKSNNNQNIDNNKINENDNNKINESNNNQNIDNNKINENKNDNNTINKNKNDQKQKSINHDKEQNDNITNQIDKPIHNLDIEDIAIEYLKIKDEKSKIEQNSEEKNCEEKDFNQINDENIKLHELNEEKNNYKEFKNKDSKNIKHDNKEDNKHENKEDNKDENKEDNKHDNKEDNKHDNKDDNKDKNINDDNKHDNKEDNKDSKNSQEDNKEKNINDDIINDDNIPRENEDNNKENIDSEDEEDHIKRREASIKRSRSHDRNSLVQNLESGNNDSIFFNKRWFSSIKKEHEDASTLNNLPGLEFISKNQMEMLLVSNTEGLFRYYANQFVKVDNNGPTKMIYDIKRSILIFQDDNDLFIAPFNHETVDLKKNLISKGVSNFFYGYIFDMVHIAVTKSNTAFSTNIEIFKIIEGGEKTTIKHIRDLYIGAAVLGIYFYNTQIIILSDEIEIIDLNSLLPQIYMHQMDFVYRYYWQLIDRLTSIDIIPITTKLFMICFTRMAFIGNNIGETYKNHNLFVWQKDPVGICILDNFLIVATENELHIWNIDTNDLVCYKRVENIRIFRKYKTIYLYDDQNLYKLVFS
ncbi:hypothetical protein DMUE_3248 [Dictyocoela muelleri]|nr:hypothetical protein DMUE_3248 [Dictyocoela muelleri]